MNRTSSSEHRSVALPARSRAGFSLVELVSVVVLIGILVALAVPRIDFTVHRVQAAMEAAGTTLLKAQRLAVQRQHNVVVAVDVDGARLRLHLDRNNNRRIDEGEPVRLEPLGEGVRVGRGSAPALFPREGPVSFSWEQEGWPAVVFHRDGSASEEGGFYLTTARGAELEENGSDARAVQVERSTGRSSWLRYSPPEWRREY